jgi:hypothetical protein
MSERARGFFERLRGKPAASARPAAGEQQLIPDEALCQLRFERNPYVPRLISASLTIPLTKGVIMVFGDGETQEEAVEHALRCAAETIKQARTAERW